MSIQFKVKEHFKCPPERLFEALTDIERAGEWMPQFIGMEKLTPGPFGVGTTFRELRGFHGKTNVEEFEVTHFDPPGRLELYADGKKGSTGRGAYRFRYDIVPSDGGAEMTLHIEAIDMSIWLRLLSPLFALVFKGILAKDHVALKAYVERKTA